MTILWGKYIKINSLNLHVEFDFDNVICKITDTERDIRDEYQCYESFGDCKENEDCIASCKVQHGILEEPYGKCR